jgi:hypothetical protein
MRVVLSPAEAHIQSSRPLFTALQLKLDIQSFLQALEIELANKVATVEEDLLAVLSMDKPESAIVHELLNRSFHRPPFMREQATQRVIWT